jgi:benzil reductase ((S)-benzoin forming)
MVIRMRTVVLTGVSRGLGAALFDGLTRRGDRVVAIGRPFTAAQRAAAESEPDRIALLPADLSRPDIPDLAPAIAGATALALVHNAGIIEPIGAVGTLPPDRVAEAVTVNLTAPMLLTNAFLAAVPHGATEVRILFISSGAARQVIGGWGVYCATKSGGEMFFDALATQLAHDPRYTVANVSPGVMDTDMQATIRHAEFPDRERFVGLHTVGDLRDPADVATKIISTHLTS